MGGNSFYCYVTINELKKNSFQKEAIAGWKTDAT